MHGAGSKVLYEKSSVEGMLWSILNAYIDMHSCIQSAILQVSWGNLGGVSFARIFSG